VSEDRTDKLNLLLQALPEGLLADAHWLEQRGIYPSLRNRYVASGWLEQPARGVYRRPRGALRWQQVVTSLQTILAFPVVAGGRTALEMEGYTHYLKRSREQVHLYGTRPLPGWTGKLPINTRFVFHNSRRLFPNDPDGRGVIALDSPKESTATAARGDLMLQTWGQWDWPLALSTPERACLELLDELPDRESFEQVDKLFESLAGLRPRRLQDLLMRCRSVKVKRLFFFFADRHRHAWRKHLDKDTVNLGKGKRMLVKGGRLDPVYQITVPEELYAVQ
jgi:hypothetical protein